MADKKISQLTNLTGASLAEDDEFVLVDTSADETKAITWSELKEGLDTGTGFVRITGDTMTGDLTVPNVVVSGNVDGRDVSADGTKLDGIEAGAEVNAVDSVNTQTGSVVLDADDISDTTTTNKFTTAGDISKLSGIEAGADVTDTANVTAAGALMDSEVTNLDQVKAFDETDYATAAQGTLADSAVQPNDSPTFGTVTATSFSGDGSALTGLPAGYTDSDVDTHLNYSTATTGQVLSFSGSDYDWVDAASGAGGGGSDEIFYENGQNVTTNYTITNGKNAMSAGPITVDSGVTVTVGAGETWTVV